MHAITKIMTALGHRLYRVAFPELCEGPTEIVRHQASQIEKELGDIKSERASNSDTTPYNDAVYANLVLADHGVFYSHVESNRGHYEKTVPAPLLKNYDTLMESLRQQIMILSK